MDNGDGDTNENENIESIIIKCFNFPNLGNTEYFHKI